MKAPTTQSSSGREPIGPSLLLAAVFVIARLLRVLTTP